MFSPPYISQGEELSSDNRKQVLREGEALGGDGGRRGGQRENRGLQVCRTEETGDERREKRGDCVQKNAVCTEARLPKMEVSQARIRCPSQLTE